MLFIKSEVGRVESWWGKPAFSSLCARLPGSWAGRSDEWELSQVAVQKETWAPSQHSEREWVGGGLTVFWSLPSLPIVAFNKSSN